MKSVIVMSVLFASTAFANKADEYMKSFECLPGQSWAGCLYLAGAQATKEMDAVLNKLSACVEKTSKGFVNNPKAKLLKEQAAFRKYADSQQSYLPLNGPHAAQSLHAARLLLVLERTDVLKHSLQFCTDAQNF